MTRAQDGNRLLAILGSGARSSRELQNALGISQPQVSRLISSLGSEVLRLGRGTATLYAHARDIRGYGYDFPIYRVTGTGDLEAIGTLYTLQRNQYWWVPVDGPGELFDHLPWFIQDMRPDGFMGRAFANRIGPQLRLPDRLQYWSADHILVALSTRGEDLMGNVIVGQDSLGRYLEMTHQPCEAVNINSRSEVYPGLVKAAMEGDPPGSSAAGEQPKFAALVEDNGEFRHVLVKFSPLISTPAGRRWADLIVCEHIALNLIRERGIDSASSQLLVAEDRYLLEVTRFDRRGRFGRLPMLSLEAIDLEFFGHLDNWIAAASRLEDNAMLSQEDAANLRWLSLFSSLIADTDQHFGNVSLIMEDGRRRFSLAPAYDILPMLYRPQEDNVPTRTFSPGIEIASRALDLFPDALDWAIKFWEEVAEDHRITQGFREICGENLEIVKSLISGPQLLVKNS